MDTKGKKAVVIGCGISGIAAAELLLSQGVETVLYDGNEALTPDDVWEKSEKLKEEEIPVLTGEWKTEWYSQFSIAVLSPGVPVDLPFITKMQDEGIALWGEIELAYHFGKGRVIAITGTNGKTTTTALTGEIMKHYFKTEVEVVGNIGIPYTSVVSKMTEKTVTVAEISSFQLETIHDFCPEVSAILNITPDHLNRHHTMEAYIAAKKAIAKNQKPGQTCVLNYEDEVLRKFGETLEISVIYFSSRRKLDRGLYLDNGSIYLAEDTGIRKVVDTEKLQLLGLHNYENVMAAVGVSLAFGVPLENITEVLYTFQAVEHRIEYVEEIAGVRYYNDSKGTNPDAAIQGIRAMNWPTYLIGGGYDKQSEYGEWIEAFDGKVKALVLIGATKEKIAETARQKGFQDIVLCDTLEEATEYCHAHAQPGEAVLLSPACASWDMFKSYEERGRIFKELVRKYK